MSGQKNHAPRPNLTLELYVLASFVILFHAFSLPTIIDSSSPPCLLLSIVLNLVQDQIIFTWGSVTRCLRRETRLDQIHPSVTSAISDGNKRENKMTAALSPFWFTRL